MPIREKDPWREQYFQNVACPKDLIIPTDDGDAYGLFPHHRWIYNKLMICETQGLDHGPHGIDPQRFPVFSKPIYNMRGMGTGSRILNSYEEYELNQAPGHMWMPLMEGEHVSSDTVVIDGEPQWWRHTIGKGLGEGMFDYWIVLAESRPAIEDYCGEWLRRNLRGYTGAVNFETIGGRIIEAHLRFSDQWPDLYGEGWVDCIVELYQHQRWRFVDRNRRTGYSVVLFGPHGIAHRSDPAEVEAVRREPGVSSVQITFHEDKLPEAHAMPPGGFRLAIVNCWNLDVGFKARERLALMFWSTQEVRAQEAIAGA